VAAAFCKASKFLFKERVVQANDFTTTWQLQIKANVELMTTIYAHYSHFRLWTEPEYIFDEELGSRTILGNSFHRIHSH
jgi:hypothetical protein